MRLTLKDHGYPYYKIMDGKRWIGRTYRAADGTFTCVIGKRVVYAGAASHEQAFEEGGARYMGFASAAEYRERAAAAKLHRAAVRADAVQTAANMLSRDPAVRSAAFDRFFSKMGAGR